MPCPGECSGKAGQNGSQCLLLLLTEIWLFTENQGEKRGSTSSGLCVRAACRVTVWAGMVQLLPSSPVTLPSLERSWGKVGEPRDLPKGLWDPSAVLRLSTISTAAAGNSALAPGSVAGLVVPVLHVVLTGAGSGFSALS